MTQYGRWVDINGNLHYFDTEKGDVVEYKEQEIDEDFIEKGMNAIFEDLKKYKPDTLYDDLRKIIQEDRYRWIPVTERLPEEGERVLATHLGGLNPNRQVIEHIYENGKFTCNWDMDMDITSPTFGERYMGDVIAWMPEPKPYEGSVLNGTGK